MFSDLKLQEVAGSDTRSPCVEQQRDLVNPFLAARPYLFQRGSVMGLPPRWAPFGARPVVLRPGVMAWSQASQDQQMQIRGTAAATGDLIAP